MVCTMLDVLFIGNLAYQIEKQQSGYYMEHFTGSGYYTTLAAKLISNKIQLASCVGKDYPLSILSEIIPNHDGIKVRNKGNTATFTVFEKGKKRIFHEKPGVSLFLNANHIPKSFYKTRSIHLASMRPHIQQRIINKLLKKGVSKELISVDAFDLYTQKNPKLTHKVLV